MTVAELELLAFTLAFSTSNSDRSNSLLEERSMVASPPEPAKVISLLDYKKGFGHTELVTL